LALARYNVTAPIEAANVPVTNAPEPILGVRG
ncbi:MAG: hypothetical protein JWM38_2477, partial [Sphingomonas bacterium]|nr:hypothetical protein [Sphingomonas bacterium]